MTEGSFTLTPEVITELFGTEAAEDEKLERFQQYSIKGKTFEGVYNQLPLRIIVGYKGSGKSATMRIAYNEDKIRSHYPIWLTHSNINSFENIEAAGLSLSEGVNSWLKNLHFSIVREICARYLDINDKQIDFDAILYSPTDNDSISCSLQRCLVSLRGFRLKNLRDHQIVVYIDDIDVGWSGTLDHIHFILALLNSLRVLSRSNPSVSFRIGLRSDVYFLVRTSDESTDKFQETVV